MTAIRQKLLEYWLRQFLTAFGVLALTKAALVLVTVFGPGQLVRETRLYSLVKSLSFYGSDVLGAAVVAALILVLVLPLLLRPDTARRAEAWGMGLQVLHAWFAVWSFFFVVFQGGPLNKQAIDILLFNSANDTGFWNAGLWESVLDCISPWSLSFLGLALGSPLVFGRLAAKLVPRLKGRLGRNFAVACVVLAAYTVLLVPVLVSGRAGGFRLLTNGLDGSFLPELVASYAEPALRRALRPYEIPPESFELDLSSEAALQGEADLRPPKPPLAGVTPQRTNVVFITLESASMRYLDRPDTPMPFTMGLAKRPGAVSFRAHYTNWALTTKALFAIMTSELPHPTFKAESLLNPNLPTESLSAVLHDAGYFTAFLTGQDLNYDHQRRFYDRRKFDLILDSHDMPGLEPQWVGGWGLDDRLVTRNVVQVMTQQRDRPFFLFYMLTAGHHPFSACAEHVAAPLPTREAAYDRAQAFADDRVKEIIQALEQLNLLDQTLVVVVSDHGEGHARYVGRNVLEPLVNVPLILLGPQLQGQHPDQDLQTSHLDLAPTILGLLGLPVPWAMKGRNLTQQGQAQIAFFGGRPPRFQLGLADQRWKYILEDGYTEMLFDLKEDPLEEHNLVSTRSDVLKVYRQRLEVFDELQRDLLENYTTLRARASQKK